MIWSCYPYTYFCGNDSSTTVDTLHGQEVILRHTLYENGGSEYTYMYGRIVNLKFSAPSYAEAIEEVLSQALPTKESIALYNFTVIEMRVADTFYAQNDEEVHWLVFSPLQHACMIAASRKYMHHDMPEFRLPTIHRLGYSHGVTGTYAEDWEYVILDPHDESWTPLEDAQFSESFQAYHFKSEQKVMLYLKACATTLPEPHAMMVARLKDIDIGKGFFAYSIMQNDSSEWQSRDVFFPDEQTMEHHLAMRGVSQEFMVKRIKEGWDYYNRRYYLADGKAYTIKIQMI